MIERLRSDYRFRLLLLMGMAAIVAIGIMARVRYLAGDLRMMWVDIGIMTAIFVCDLAMLLGAPSARMAQLATLLCNVGIAVVIWLSPDSGTYWYFAVVVATFMLFHHYGALALCLGVLGVAVCRHYLLDDVVGFWSFLTSASTVILLMYVFAYREHRHRDQLEAHALQDPLTGLGNRRAFTTRVVTLIEEARRNNTSLGLFLLDLDLFKRVNDTYGHAEGDRVLRDFARVIQHNIRGQDELFRLGGEEFVLLMPGMLDAHLKRHGEYLLDVVRQAVDVKGEPVTASIGATLWQDDELWKACLARADAALYQAKASGRDRVEMA